MENTRRLGRKTWFAVALVAGLVSGYVASSAVSRGLFNDEARFNARYQKFRRMAWEVSQGFCPDGYRVLGKPEQPADSFVVMVTSGWYGNGNEYNTAVPLALGQNGWLTTQVGLAYVRDECGYAITVHMVFTPQDLGREALALPVAGLARGAGGVVPPDWRFVATRDNVLFFFQVVPVLDKDAGGATESYPIEWIDAAYSFVRELRRFLDERNF